MLEENQEPQAEPQAAAPEMSVVTRLKKTNKELTEKLSACDQERNVALERATKAEGLLLSTEVHYGETIKNNQRLIAEVRKLRDLVKFYLEQN